MRCLLSYLLMLLLLAGCAGNPAGDNLKARNSSNAVAETNLNLGVAYMQRGEYEKALEKLDRAYKADPDYYATQNAYGLLYQELGKPKLADEHFRKALRLNSQDSGTRNNYGQFLCQQGHYQKAESMFEKAAQNPLYKTPAIPLTNAGICAIQNHNTAKAEQYFRHALKIDPRIPAALLHMAHISYDKGNYMSARGYLQRYQQVAKHTPDSLWLGIRVERKLGDKDAVASYGLLLKNNFPDSDEASRYLESLKR